MKKNRVRLSLSILSLIFYILLFFILYPHVKEKAGIFAILPIIVTGILFGFRTALIFPAVIIPLNFIIYSQVDKSYLQVFSNYPVEIISHFLAGIFLGFLRDTYRKSKQQYQEITAKNSQLEKEIEERIKTEKELISLKTNLENIIEERTSALKKTNVKLSVALKEQIKIEMKIRQSEEYYKLLFESIHDPIFIFEPRNEIILDVNKKACEVYGFSREEFIGMSLKKISLNPDYGEKQIDLLLGENSLLKFETNQYKKDGSLLVLDVSATIIENQGQKVILSINRDITQQKAEEKRINLLAHSLESINDSVIISDNNGIINFVNKKFLEVFDYHSDDEVINKNYETLFPDKANFKNCFANLSLVENKSVKRECSCIAKSGREFPVNISVSSVKNKKDENIAKVFVIEDITERKTIENELNKYKLHLEELVNERTSQLTEANMKLNEEIEEREKVKQQLVETNIRLDIAIQAAGNGFADLNFKDNKIYFNSIFSEQLGFSKIELKELVDKWEQLVHPDDIENIYKSFSEHINNNTGPAEFVHRLTTREGVWKWFSTKIKIVDKDDNNFPLRLFIVLEDITLRKKAEENLLNNLAKEKELTETRSKFISLVSHEFRTPLSTILSSLELVENYGHKWTQEKIKNYYEKMKNSIDYLTELLNEVSTINKAEAGMLQFNPQQFELAKYLEELIDEVKNIYKESPEIHFLINERPVCVNFDSKLLRHIFHNLLENAVKYTPSEKNIYVECLTASSELVLSIRDEGIGISNEDQKKLFEPFTRGNNVVNLNGTGLGLSIVKKSVDVCKGNINIESELNKGTKVTVILPLISCEKNNNLTYPDNLTRRF